MAKSGPKPTNPMKNTRAAARKAYNMANSAARATARAGGAKSLAAYRAARTTSVVASKPTGGYVKSTPRKPVPKKSK